MLKMNENILHEIHRCSVNEHNVFLKKIEWSERSLFVMNGKDLFVYDFTCNLHQKQKPLDLRNTIISCPVGHPAAGRYNLKLFHRSRVTNFQYNEMLADPIYWPFISIFAPDMSIFISAQWSPAAFTYRNYSLLAGLSNMSILYIYGKSKFGWVLLCDFYMAIEEFYNITDLDIPNKNSMRNVGQKIGTISFCWGPKCTEDSYIIITAQRNGDILFWKCTCIANKIDLQPLAMLSLDEVEKVNLNCVSVSVNHYILLYSNNLGQLYAHVISIQDDNITLLKSISLWSDPDKIVIRHIKHIITDNFLILAFSKHRHLIVQMIDESYSIKDQYISNINDYTINSLITHSQMFYFCTQNCVLYELDVSINDNKLNISTIQKKLKDSYSNYLLKDFSISRNKSFWTFLMANCDSFVGKGGGLLDTVFLTPTERHENELMIVLENPKKNFNGFWDVLELFRHKTMKLKLLPQINYEELYKESESDLYKLKVYLIIAILHKSLKDLALLFKTIPEDDIERIKETILAKHCLNTLTENTNCNLEMLENRKIEILVNCQNYFACYCQKYNLNLYEFIEDNLKDFKDKYKYICESCDSELEGFNCKNKHINAICSRTLTPIGDKDYVTCVCCNAIALLDKKNESYQCVFCDLYMDDNNIT